MSLSDRTVLFLGGMATATARVFHGMPTRLLPKCETPDHRDGICLKCVGLVSRVEIKTNTSRRQFVEFSCECTAAMFLPIPAASRLNHVAHRCPFRRPLELARPRHAVATLAMISVLASICQMELSAQRTCQLRLSVSAQAPSADTLWQADNLFWVSQTQSPDLRQQGLYLKGKCMSNSIRSFPNLRPGHSWIASGHQILIL